MAKHISDFSKLPLEIVFDLINEQNGTALNNTEVVLGQPTVATGSGGYNTSILVSARPNSRYEGAVTLGYDRLDVEGFLFGDTLTLSLGDATNYADLIPEINHKLRVNLTPDDYVDGPIGTWSGTPGESKQIILQMKPSSLVFIGELSFTLHVDDIPLSDVIVISDLSGLTYQPPA
jgi:hypothetical protein